MKLTSRLFVIFLALATFLAACGNEPVEEEDTEKETTDEEVVTETIEPLEIYTTIFPLEDFTNKIGGDYVNVKNVVPVGADAHSFEPTAKTMVDVAEADAFIYNGTGIEGFAEALIDSLGNENVIIVKASEGIELINYNHEDHEHKENNHGHGHEDDHEHEADHGHSHEDDHEHVDKDPHVWLDPILAITLAENIKNTLVELNPEASEEFESNFTALKEELEALDAEFQDMVATLTHDTFIVSHAGYGYWTERYGLNQIGISGLSPTNEPSINQLQQIIDYADRYGIYYVFFEENVSSKVAENVQNEIGAEALRLHNLEAVTQEDIDNNDDYFSLMRQNIEALRTALQ